MQKLLLISILLATIVVPARAARLRSTRRGFVRMLAWMALFNLAYLVAVLYVYPRLP